MKKQTKEAINGFMLSAAFCGTLFAGVHYWLSMPVVGVDEYGNCKWVELAPDFERRDCPKELPKSYDEVRVK